MPSDNSEFFGSVFIPPSFRRYNYPLATKLANKFPSVAISERKFDNEMPLYIVYGEAPNAVMMWLLNGDNWKEATTDIIKAHALTQNDDLAGSNVDQLGIFAPFMDLRQDQRTRKPHPEKLNETMIVKGQAGFSQPIARLMKHVAEIDYLIGLDIHSLKAVNHFLNEGIEVVNLTAAFLIADEVKNRGLIKDDMETIVCGVDMGNLSIVKALSEYLDLPIAIIHKKRESIRRGTESKTSHELVFGDVSGKRIIIIDDMISSGGTFIKTINLLLEHGAKEIIICATHPVLASNAYYGNIQKILGNEKVKLVMTTNSIPLMRPNDCDKDQPYIQENRNEKKLEILNIDNFIIQTLQILLTSKTLDQAKNNLEKNTIQLEDPYKIYEKITGEKIEKSRDTAIYRGKGKIDPLPNRQ